MKKILFVLMGMFALSGMALAQPGEVRFGIHLSSPPVLFGVEAYGQQTVAPIAPLVGLGVVAEARLFFTNPLLTIGYVGATLDLDFLIGRAYVGPVIGFATADYSNGGVTVRVTGLGVGLTAGASLDLFPVPINLYANGTIVIPGPFGSLVGGARFMVVPLIGFYAQGHADFNISASFSIGGSIGFTFLF
jgi:hypothetical protein